MERLNVSLIRRIPVHTWLLSFSMLAVAFSLPMLGLQRFEHDATPALGAVVLGTLAIGVLVHAYRPAALKTFFTTTSLAWLVLAALSVLSMLYSEAGSVPALALPLP